MTDSRRRVIAISKLSVLNYYQLTKAMGDGVADRTLNMAVIAAAVRRMDTLDLRFRAASATSKFSIADVGSRKASRPRRKGVGNYSRRLMGPKPQKIK